MISGFIISAIAPYLITKFGGMALLALLTKVGVSQATAGTIAPQLASALAKLFGAQGHTMTPEEQAALAAHVQQTKPQKVPAHPGSTFRSL